MKVADILVKLAEETSNATSYSYLPERNCRDALQLYAAGVITKDSTSMVKLGLMLLSSNFASCLTKADEYLDTISTTSEKGAIVEAEKFSNHVQKYENQSARVSIALKLFSRAIEIESNDFSKASTFGIAPRVAYYLTQIELLLIQYLNMSIIDFYYQNINQ